ncbi:MAG: M56 family metallopeptidase [Planctomycetota bacterium]
MTEYDVLCERLCWTLLHSLWQMTLFALAAGCLSRFCLRGRTNIAYLTHTAALMFGVAALPLTFLATGTQFDSSRPVTSTWNAERFEHDRTSENGISSSPDHAQPASLPMAAKTTAQAAMGPTAVAESQDRVATDLWRWTLPWFAAVYVIGVLIMLARLAWSFWYVERIRRVAQTVTEGPVRIAIESLCKRWSLRVIPALAHSNQVLTPKVVGLIKPTILLPASALSGLSVGELELILSHELAHLRRHDLWVNLFQRVAESLLFFNPATWWLSRRVSLLREFCCDDQALASAGNSDEPQLRYAEALLRCVQLSEDRIVGIGSLGTDGRSPSELRRRVARVLGESITEPLPRLTRGSVTLLFLGAVIFAGSWFWPGEDTSAASGPSWVGQTETVDGDGVRATNSEVDRRNEQSAKTESTNSDQPATLSGQIVMADGSPASVEGWMSYDTRFENGNGASGTAEQFTNQFDVKVGPGTTYLTHHVKGYAPAWTPKIELKPGQRRGDLKLILTDGTSQRVRLVNARDEPISGATLLAHPVIHGQSGGFNFPKTTDQNGEHVFTHLAATKYSIRAEADGYEPIRGQIVELRPGETIRLSMTKSVEATGVVLRASDRSPLAAASVRLIHESNETGGDRSFSDSRSDNWWGEEYAKTRQRGQFTLDRLVRGGRYLALIETSDGSRAMVDSIEAGTYSEILMPKRSDLIIEFNGDIDTLPDHRRGPRVNVRQRVRFKPKPNHTVGELLGMNVPIRRTETGGRAVVNGLAVDLRPTATEQQVEVSVSGTSLSRSVTIDSQGTTKVVFQLPPQDDSEVESKPSAKGQSLILKLVDNDGRGVPGLKTRIYDGQKVWTGNPARYKMEHATTDIEGAAVFAGFFQRLPERAGYWIEIFHPENNRWRIPKRLIGWRNRLSNVSDPLITTQENQQGFTITVTLREECPTELDILDAETGQRKHFAQLLFKDARVEDWTLAALQDYIGDPGGDDVSKLGLDFFTTIVPEMSKSEFMATREGYYPVEFALPDLALDRTVRRRVELQPAPEIELTVIDRDGKPCVNAKLEYLGPKARGSVRPIKPSDEQGRITLPFPELGKYARYRVSHQRGTTEFSGSLFATPDSPVEKPIEVLRETIQLQAKPNPSENTPIVNAGGSPENSGKVRGEVLGLIEGGEGVRYSITLETDSLQRERKRRQAQLPEGRRSLGPRRPGLVVDDGETFEFTDVPPGRCKVVATAINQKERKIVGKPVTLELDVRPGHTSVIGLAINHREHTTAWLKKTLPFAEDKPAALPTNLVWGEVVAGLQAAIEVKAPASIALDPTRRPGAFIGTKLNVVFHVKNVSDNEITFVSEEGRQGDILKITNDEGTPIKLRETFFTGAPIDKRWRLRPGDIARLSPLSCPVDQIETAGTYTLRYTLRFNSRQQRDNDGNLVFPRPGDYTEELPTGDAIFFLQKP